MDVLRCFPASSMPVLHRSAQHGRALVLSRQRWQQPNRRSCIIQVAQSERPGMMSGDATFELLTAHEHGGSTIPPPPIPAAAKAQASSAQQQQEQRMQRALQRRREQLTYKVSAIAVSTGFASLAIAATYLRFSRYVSSGTDVPLLEMAGTLALVFGGAIGMEMWARYAHEKLWHDYEPGWALHKSHHEPRIGPFEANDVFAIMNGVPAMALCAYGFFTPGLAGGLAFGAGLGVTLFGIAYMFFHDGLVHRRFPVGPIAQHPYMKRVAVAHQLHHSEKYGGVPWGMFLGPQEVEALPGGKEELDRLVAQLDWSKR